MVLFVVLFTLLQTSAPNKHLAAVPSVSQSTVKPGSKVSLYLDVTPKPGIHVYAPGAKDYIPISLEIQPAGKAKPSTPVYPKSQTMTFEGQKVPVYDRPFRIVQDVTIDPSTKAGDAVAVTGTFKFQACDDKVCFIPASLPVSWSISIQ